MFIDNGFFKFYNLGGYYYLFYILVVNRVEMLSYLRKNILLESGISEI